MSDSEEGWEEDEPSLGPPHGVGMDAGGYLGLMMQAQFDEYDDGDSLDDSDDMDSDDSMDGTDADVDPPQDTAHDAPHIRAYLQPFAGNMEAAQLRNQYHTSCENYALHLPTLELDACSVWVQQFYSVAQAASPLTLFPFKQLSQPESRVPIREEFELCTINDKIRKEIERGGLYHVRDSRQRGLLMYAMKGGVSGLENMLPFRDRSVCKEQRWRQCMCDMLRSVDAGGRSIFHYAAHHGTIRHLAFVISAFNVVRTWAEFTNREAGDRTLLPLPANSLPSSGDLLSALQLAAVDPQPTALCQAAFTGNEETVKRLLEAGVKDLQLKPLQDTALICAATIGSVDVVRALLASGVSDVLARGVHGDCAVHRAAVCQHVEVLNLILDTAGEKQALEAMPKGWDSDLREVVAKRWRATALVRVACGEDIPGLKEMLATGVKVELPDQPTDNLFHSMAAHSASETIEYLGQQLPEDLLKSLLLHANQRGRMPLHSAFDPLLKQVAPHVVNPNKLQSTVKSLLCIHRRLQLGADVRNAHDNSTPLLLLSRHVFESATPIAEIAEQLLKHESVDPNLSDNRGETPLMAAASAGNRELLALLIHSGANTRAAAAYTRDTALHMVVNSAAPEGVTIEMVQQLVAHGADLNATDDEDKSPVAWASEMRKAGLLLEMIRLGGSLEWSSDIGYDAFLTLFHRFEDEGTQRELRDAQQNSDNCVRAGEMCAGKSLDFVAGLIDRAIAEGFHKMASAVTEQHKHRKDNENNGLLLVATANGLDHLVKHLVYLNGIDISARNKYGEAAIDMAVRLGSWESFLDLYGAGAQPPDSPNAELMIAASLHSWMKVEAILKRISRELSISEDLGPVGSPGRSSPEQPREATPLPDSETNTTYGSGPLPPVAAQSRPADDVLPPAKRHRSSGAEEPPSVPLREPPATILTPSRRNSTSTTGLRPVAPSQAPSQASPATALAGPSTGAAVQQAGAAPQPDTTTSSRFRWLIAQLMSSREPGNPSLSVGQPCVTVRDRILALLRPMMNFQEKVAYFLDEQDRLYDYQYDELADDVMHIDVHRGDGMLVEAVNQINQCDEETLQREMTVSFCGEDGEDGGGLLKEFCQELAAAVLKPGAAIFREVPEHSGLYEPSEKAAVQADSVDVRSMFRALGIVVAKAITMRACFPVRFTRSFLKQMLDEPLDLSDLRHVDPDLHRGLMSYLHNDVSLLGMDDTTFTAEVQYFGETVTKELKPNGANILVTNENKEEYVALRARFTMTESIKEHIAAFCEGLWACMPLDSLRIFAPDQLGLLISGRLEINLRELQAAVTYEGFTAEAQTIKWFWEIVREMPSQEVGLLLAFMTGSARVPAVGFKGLRTPLMITRAAESRLPSSHTCINQIVLSEYTDKELLRQHLQEALKQPAGFHFR